MGRRDKGRARIGNAGKAGLGEETHIFSREEGEEEGGKLFFAAVFVELFHGDGRKDLTVHYPRKEAPSGTLAFYDKMAERGDTREDGQRAASLPGGRLRHREHSV